MRSLKNLLTVALLFVFTGAAFGQVTTGSITGSIRDTQGQPLIGATIKATHLPTGTVYGTSTLTNGNYSIPNMRIGGPYRIEISYVGYQTMIINGINLVLGEPFSLNETLKQSGQQLSEVTVVASAGKLSLERTGASTNVNSLQLATLPSLSRSISSFTKIVPQGDGSNDFGGRDGRYNNIQVDGVNLNNSFGLSSDPLPGGGSSPISIDALSEISVNIAPFDVRQSDFTGAGINVATKSGTNTFKGSVYGYYANQNFNGTKVDGQTLSTTPQSHKTYGFNLGGPIIKNKLFFFVNGEIENQSSPGITFVPAGVSGSNPSSTPVDSLQALSGYLKSKYNYNAGAFENFPNFVTKNHKILAKVDWNINQVHKLTVKYTDFRGSDMSPLNGSSVPTGGEFFVTGQAKGLSRLPNNRFSDKSMSFANSNYGTDHVVQTGNIELNSNFNSKFSNQFIATYTHISDIRSIPGGQMFPTIDIFNGQGQNQLSAGTDPFTPNNEVINNVLDFTDNFTFFSGAHTFTFGATYEHQRVGNMFMGGSNSYYIYNSLADFLSDAPPVYYGLTYAYYGQSKTFSANLKYGQAGIYAQDEFQVNNKLKLTLGIRGDIPVFGTSPISNPAITALSFPNSRGQMENFNTGKWPNTSLYLSPRLGFRWDIMGDRSLILRGGTGIFTGKMPLVWLTNMPSNNGMYQNTVSFNTPAAIAQNGIVFDPNPAKYKNLFAQSPNPPVAPKSFVMIDPKFKFPQIWRTDVGLDKALGDGFTASVDLEFTKDIHAVRMVNANLKAPSATLTGPDPRSYYPSTQTGSSLLYYPDLTQDILLENTPKGYSMFGTVQVSKSFSHGFYGSIAYTYTKSEEVSPNPGSRATSAWQSINNVGPTNFAELGGSEYAIPNRVVANVAYRIEYTHHMATTISLYYQGMNSTNYSYIYNGSIVGDGNSQLMYIYHSGSDVPFIANGSFTVAQEQQAYDQFINSSRYLRKHKGQYASRYAALTPWFNTLDLKLLQDFYLTSKGGTHHDLQVSLTMNNFPNLISSKWKNWGYSQMYSINNPLIFSGVDAKGEPTFKMNKYKGQLATQAIVPNISSTRVWELQLGLRYSF